jgi:predicted ATPase/DNA-binding SARP family transcriptional activator
MTISASPRTSSVYASRPVGLVIYALGRFAVYAAAEDQPLTGRYWAQRKVQSLFKVLLASDGHRVHRERAQDILWPDFDLDQAAMALRRTLYRLRQALAPAGSGPDAMIRLDSDTLSIVSGAISFYDADRFEQLATELINRPREIAHYEEALALYGGDFLPDDLYEDWARALRERLRGLYVTLAETLSGRYVADGRIPAAIARLQELLRIEPVHERAHRSLMQLYAHTDRRDDALRQFQLCKAALQEGLNVEPGAETLALYREIAAGTALPAPDRSRGATPAPKDDPPALGQRAQPKRASFVGRVHEWRELQVIAQAVRSGRGRVIALAGEPGAGKSRLAREFARQQRQQGAEVLWGHCYELSGALPYGPLVEILSRHARTHPSADALRAAGSQLGVLATLVTEIRTHAPETEALPLATPETGQLRLFEAVTSYLLRAAQQARPLILVLDDLHWADAATLHLLDYFARQVADAPLLLVILYRDTEVDSGGRTLRTMLQNWRRDGLATLLPLKPLSAEEVQRLLVAYFGGEVDARLAQRLYQRTAGNAFFTRELAIALLESGSVHQQDQSWRWTETRDSDLPESVRTAVETRVARLGEAAATLRAAAVLGTRFDSRLLIAVRRADGLSEEQVLNDLEAAARAKLLLELSAEAATGTQSEDFAFSHDLIREALYHGLLGLRRRRLHRQVVRALEELDNPDSRAETLAYHYEAAGELERAIDYLLRAARHAEALYAYETAITSYRAALDRIQRMPGGGPSERRRETWARLSAAQERVADLHGTLQSCEEALKLGGALELRTELYLRMAETERALGDYDRMRQRCEAGLRDLDEQQRAGRRPGPVPAALLRKALAVGLYRQGHYDDALAICGDVLDTLSAANATAYLADTYYVLGEIHGHRGDLKAARAYHERALELYQQHDDLAGMARSYNCIGTYCADLNDLDSAIAYLQRSVELHRRIGNTRGVYAALNNLSYLLTYRAEYDQALACTSEALAMVRRTGDPFVLISISNNIGQIYERLGNLDEAFHYYQDVQDASIHFDDALLHWVIAANMTAIHALLGNLEEAEHYAEQGIAMAETTRSSFSMLLAQRSVGNLALACEDYARARAAFLQCLTYDHNAEEALTEAHLGLAQCDLHDKALDAAECHAQEALTLATAANNDPYQAARAQRIIAQIASARGEWERARELFVEAIATHRRLGNALEEGRALHTYALALTPRARAEARTHLEQACDLFARCHARLDLEAAAAALAALDQDAH